MTNGIIPVDRYVVGLAALAAAKGLVPIIDVERVLICLCLVGKKGIHKVVINICSSTVHYHIHQAFLGWSTSIRKSSEIHKSETEINYLTCFS